MTLPAMSPEKAVQVFVKPAPLVRESCFSGHGFLPGFFEGARGSVARRLQDRVPPPNVLEAVEIGVGGVHGGPVPVCN